MAPAKAAPAKAAEEKVAAEAKAAAEKAAAEAEAAAVAEAAKAAEEKVAAEAKAAAEKAAADLAVSAPTPLHPGPEAEPADGEVEVIVAIPIAGLRNGVPWPAVGEPINLPAAEAAGYIQFGYVREGEPSE